MKKVEELNLPESLSYTPEHIWIKEDNNGTVVCGISDFAQDQLGEIVYIDLANANGHVDSGQSFGNVESIKSVNELYMPISGEIVGINEQIEDTPSLANASCYDKGWLVRIKPDNPEDLKQLLSASDYIKTLGK